MAQGTPRKFSEKIAIIQRKGIEDLQSFAKIMNEVREVRGMQAQQPLPVRSVVNFAQSSSVAPWNSLPDVNEMVNRPEMQTGLTMLTDQPNPWMNGPSGWMGDGMSEFSGSSRVMHVSTRGRSPGAYPHFHPYKYTGAGPSVVPYPAVHHRLANRGPTDSLNYSPLIAGANLLQPPEHQWRKDIGRARSDPAIHTNAYRQPRVPSQGSAGSCPHSPSEYTPPQDTSPPVCSIRPFPLDSCIQGSSYLDPGQTVQNQTELKQNSCEPLVNYQMTSNDPNEVITSSSLGSGSLPNLPSPLRAEFYPPPYTESMTTSVGTHMAVQQRHSIQLPPGGSTYPSVQVSYSLAATPPYSAESQSAPMSPADPSTTSVSSPGSTTYEIQNQMQNIQIQESIMMFGRQQSFRHGVYQQPHQYSPTSPDVVSSSPGSQIPNIVLTGPGGGSLSNALSERPSSELGMEFLQGLRIDPTDLQQLLSNSDNQEVDPASEYALRLDHD